MENLKALINKRPGIVMYEYYCPICDKFFWTTIPEKELICPFCGYPSSINGEIPIKKMEIHDNKNTIPEI